LIACGHRDSKGKLGSGQVVYGDRLWATSRTASLPHDIVIMLDMEKRAISSWVSVKIVTRLKATFYFFDAFESGQASPDSLLGIVTLDWTIPNLGERVAAYSRPF
jgi:hypothetical protein